MKRWRPPTRPLILIALLLLAGAVVNIAVAWAAASGATAVARDPDWYMRFGLTPEFYSPPANELRMRLGEDPPIGGMTPPEVDWMVRDFLVEAWESLYTRGRGAVTGRVPADWQASVPTDWPEHCLRVQWRDPWATWRVGYTYRLDPDAADPSDWGAALTSYLLDTYRVGWPFRSLEMRWWYSGNWSEASPETMSASDGLPAPRTLMARGLFERSHGRIPTRPIPAGFAINTLFYAAIFALPLSVFPIRCRLRVRRGRCPKCGYDRTGLADPAAPCPECGATD